MNTVRSIDEALKNGMDAEELLAKLPELLGNIPADELQEHLTRAAFAARLLALAGVQIADDSLILSGASFAKG